VKIEGKVLIIKTINNCYECNFGGNVIVDNQYKLREGTSNPEYFIDGHGHKIFFNKTSPEDYLR
jgi:hypothetical protein